MDPDEDAQAVVRAFADKDAPEGDVIPAELTAGDGFRIANESRRDSTRDSHSRSSSSARAFRERLGRLHPSRGSSPAPAILLAWHGVGDLEGMLALA